MCAALRARRLSTRRTSWAWPPSGLLVERRIREAKTGGPTAKAFSANYAALYGRIGEASSTPSNLWTGDEEARQVVEQLNRDAGYEPVYAGPLENTAAQENVHELIYGIGQGGLGPFVYRMAPPDRL